MHRPLLLLLLLAVAERPSAAAVTYSTRVDFLAAVGSTITDGYTGYPAGSENGLTNAVMNAVLGQTRYEPISFPDLNMVGDIYAYGDGTNYGSGINGNFKLIFDSTSFTQNGGVFGVGLDIVFHTSRRASLGDDPPSNPSLTGTVLVEFTDGSVNALTIPADIGYYAPQVYFLGITDSRGIRSLSVGTEPLATRHSWAIDNLTIAAQVPEPCSILLHCSIGLIGLVVSQMRRSPSQLAVE